MSDQLTHIDADGRASMVDVSKKDTTFRQAIAAGFVHMDASTLEAIRQGSVEKGEVLTVARIAGIMAGKRTDDLIPLCHGLPVEHIAIAFHLMDEPSCIAIEATASTSAKTGIEMEALTAVSVAALTIYDMAKALDKTMCVSDIHLVHKTGGKSGEFNHPSPPGPRGWRPGK